MTRPNLVQETAPSEGREGGAGGLTFFHTREIHHIKLKPFGGMSRHKANSRSFVPLYKVPLLQRGKTSIREVPGRKRSFRFLTPVIIVLIYLLVGSAHHHS